MVFYASAESLRVQTRGEDTRLAPPNTKPLFVNVSAMVLLISPQRPVRNHNKVTAREESTSNKFPPSGEVSDKEVKCEYPKPPTIPYNLIYRMPHLSCHPGYTALDFRIRPVG